MPRISNIYFGLAILFLLAGIGLGLKMAITQDHSLSPVHAHVNLLGWVTSALFGTYFALNPAKAQGWLPRAQCLVYSLGLIVMLGGLYRLYDGNPEIEPVVAMGSVAVALGVLLFAVVIFKPARGSAPGAELGA